MAKTPLRDLALRPGSPYDLFARASTYWTAAITSGTAGNHAVHPATPPAAEAGELPDLNPAAGVYVGESRKWGALRRPNIQGRVFHGGK